MLTSIQQRGLAVLFSGATLLTACQKQANWQGETARDAAFQSKSISSAGGNVSCYALTDNNMLVKYSGSQTLKEEKAMSISGLQSGEMLMAIDFRPATGQLYGVSNQSRIYAIHLMSGVATALNATPFTPAINGTGVGFDFNPTVDRIRLVTNAGQDLRLNPETGMVVSVDGDLNPGNPAISAVAYTNSFAGTTSTTLYDIDAASDMLFIQNPPNSGVLVAVGSLGIDAEGEGGFDISSDNKIALAVLYGKGIGSDNANAAVSNGYQHRFYAIDLATGRASNAGNAGRNIIGIAIPTAPVAYSVSNGNSLLIFNPATQDAPIAKNITGLQSGEMILGIDFRPVNGQLYALGSSNRMYTLNASNGAATPVGTGFGATVLEGTSFGFDFNPTVDRIRIVSNTGQDLRAHPTLGTIVAIDGNLNPGMPMVDAVAYTNSFAGATTTMLYDIDYSNDMLYLQSPPNAGTLVAVGNLGVNADKGNGFDIGGTSGKAWSILHTQGQTALYSIDLVSGKATMQRAFVPMADGLAVGPGF